MRCNYVEGSCILTSSLLLPPCQLRRHLARPHAEPGHVRPRGRQPADDLLDHPLQDHPAAEGHAQDEVHPAGQVLLEPPQEEGLRLGQGRQQEVLGGPQADPREDEEDQREQGACGFFTGAAKELLLKRAELLLLLL